MYSQGSQEDLDIINQNTTIIKPRKEELNHLERLEGRLAEALTKRSNEVGLPDLNREWLINLPDNEKLDLLLNSLENPHRFKCDELPHLSKKYLFDEATNQLYNPVRVVLQTFLVEGCPYSLFKKIFDISGSAIDKWRFKLGRKNYRFKDSFQKGATHTNQATWLKWQKKLYQFAIVSLSLYHRFEGKNDNFYSFYLAQFLTTGNFHPNLISDWNKEDKEARSGD